jgi:hypothetical protein
MTATELHDEFQSASQSLKRCQCGSNAVMEYEPGCTFVYCLQEDLPVMVLPDWSPIELAEKWNRQAQPQDG